jgi:hypothetical protein
MSASTSLRNTKSMTGGVRRPNGRRIFVSWMASIPVIGTDCTRLRREFSNPTRPRRDTLNSTRLRRDTLNPTRLRRDTLNPTRLRRDIPRRGR